MSHSRSARRLIALSLVEDFDRTRETEEGYVHIVPVFWSQFPRDTVSSSITIDGLGVWGGGEKDVNMHWFAVSTPEEVAALLRLYVLGAIPSRMPLRTSLRLSMAVYFESRCIP